MSDLKLMGLVMVIATVTGCERLTGPARPARAAAPMVEVTVRRFDSLEWPAHQRRIQLPKAGVLETLARILRFPQESHPVTGIEVRNADAWEALWANVAPGDSTRAPLPFVDFAREMVYVVIADPREDAPVVQIDIDRVLRTESRYSVYTSTWTTGRRATEPRLIDAVVVPAITESVTLFVTGLLPLPPAPTPLRRAAPRAH